MKASVCVCACVYMCVYVCVYKREEGGVREKERESMFDRRLAASAFPALLRRTLLLGVFAVDETQLSYQRNSNGSPNSGFMRMLGHLSFISY